MVIRSETYVDDHENDEFSVNSKTLHVHDLPQLYTKPSAVKLLETLDLLNKSSSTSTFDVSRKHGAGTQVDPEGVPHYLTSIVSSSLAWISDEDVKERIWESASARLSERSGRNAAPSMTRQFNVNKDLAISLYEPSLTEDNLGLKTWTSSLLLARRLESLRSILPSECRHVLELGSGTGLVGIAAACLWNVNVTLTDLPEIVPNLQLNVDANSGLLEEHNTATESRISLTTSILDWSASEPQHDSSRFKVILAADPLYSPTHAGILTRTVHNYLLRTSSARFILELPLRGGYTTERAELRTLLEAEMKVVEEGTEIGYDDWEGSDGRPQEVECWWSVWGWKDEVA